LEKLEISMEEIVPAIYLIAILILVLPAFLNTNSKLKTLLKNLSIWLVIILTITMISYVLFQKI
tara:strand:- start:2199 stop:2390 length:192 start_codon:yes stop_codon:yes gene_type:complete